MILNSLSALYGGLMKLRASAYHRGLLTTERLPRPVISVGNMTTGGTGKTPMTIYLAHLLIRHGYKPAILSRGYKGQAEKNGGVVSDGKQVLMTPEMAGDEPFMMAVGLKTVPVMVGKNRIQSGLEAIRRFNPDVILCDDAFQHLRLARDLDLVLLDSRHPFGNGKVLPAGRLREPLSAITRCHAVVLTRADAGIEPAVESLKALALNRPIFRSIHKPILINPDSVKGRKLFAFSGIADHAQFRRGVELLGGNVCGYLEFPDHHRYSDSDFNTITAAARHHQADRLITTEKDYARMNFQKPFPEELSIVGIEISFGQDETAFESFVLSRLFKQT